MCVSLYTHSVASASSIKDPSRTKVSDTSHFDEFHEPFEESAALSFLASSEPQLFPNYGALHAPLGEAGRKPMLFMVAASGARLPAAVCSSCTDF